MTSNRLKSDQFPIQITDMKIINLSRGDFEGNVESAIAFIQDFCNKKIVKIKSFGWGYGELEVDGKKYSINPYGIDLTMMLEYCGANPLIPESFAKRAKKGVFDLFKSGTTFNFKSLNSEITIDEYPGNRQLELNPGVQIKVRPNNISITIACNNFRNDVQTQDPSYNRICISQANEINKLIELLENIQNKASSDDLRKLEEMKTCISKVCAKAVVWAGDEEEMKRQCNAYQFIIPGRRVNADTFDLIEVETKKDFEVGGPRC